MPTFTETLSSTFTGSDEIPLSEGGVWATLTGEGQFDRVSNQAVPGGAGASDCGMRHTTAVADNQYSRASLTCVGTAGGGSGIGLSVRQASGARTYYRFVIDHAASNNAELSRFVAGTYGLVDTRWTQAFTDGDEFTLAIEGTTLYVYDKTLTLVKSFDDAGNGGPTTGSVGLSFSSTETSSFLDGWSAGTFSSAAGGPSSAGADTATAGLTDTMKTVSVSLSIAESG